MERKPAGKGDDWKSLLNRLNFIRDLGQLRLDPNRAGQELGRTDQPEGLQKKRGSLRRLTAETLGSLGKGLARRGSVRKKSSTRHAKSITHMLDRLRVGASSRRLKMATMLASGYLVYMANTKPSQCHVTSEKLAPRAWKCQGWLVVVEGPHSRIYQVWIPNAPFRLTT